ncbi:MAG: aminotransferase class I/II-fold pyridoxal phosphate-dependent enzyme [Xanthomonadales bacterium]|nr:aminotransferase class I/II-fold pyridoxal phosphate-dependent enzyme [Xanthomonadales bacterium]
MPRRLLRAHPKRGALLLTDGVFSMDGDLAPLPALAALARAEGALLLVDDAHGLGVLGPEGRGSVAAHGLGPAEVPLLMGGFGKAFGAAGAFLAGPAALLGGLVEEARGLVYSTAPPPALAAALRVALGRLRAAEERRERLRALVTRFRAGAAALGLPLLPSTTPIQPLAVGEEGRALRIAEALAERGFLVPAIRPPTVPPGTARLRISLSALHREAEIDALLEALAAALAADPA